MLNQVMLDLLRLSRNQNLSESERRTCEKAHSILADVFRMKDMLDTAEQSFRDQKGSIFSMFGI